MGGGFKHEDNLDVKGEECEYQTLALVRRITSRVLYIGQFSFVCGREIDLASRWESKALNILIF